MDWAIDLLFVTREVNNAFSTRKYAATPEINRRVIRNRWTMSDIKVLPGRRICRFYFI
jgi:hypothetical protein